MRAVTSMVSPARAVVGGAVRISTATAVRSIASARRARFVEGDEVGVEELARGDVVAYGRHHAEAPLVGS